MQITPNDFHYSAPTQNKLDNLELPTQDDIPNANTISTATPSTRVSLTGPKELPVVYEPSYLDFVQLRQTTNKGDIASKIDSQLSSQLSSIKNNTASFSTSSFFNHIGALSKETLEYNNEARSTRLLGTKVTEKNSISFSDAIGKPKETVSLRIHTKEGDTINIHLQHNTGENGDSISFSFAVDGKLSEQEQDALNQLANKLGDVADDFFRTGSTALNGLKEFDKAQLQDFHIELRSPKTPAIDNTVTYDYAINEKNNTQHLVAKDSDDYRIDITTQLGDQLSSTNTAFDKTLATYLNIIRNSLNEHQPLLAENSTIPSTQFIIDSFNSMFDHTSKPNALTNTTQNEKIWDAFDTGLPDFQSTITAPLFQDHRNWSLPEAFNLRLEQKTQQEQQADGRLLTKQTNTYEQISSRIAGIHGTEKGDLDTGNYTYKTIHEKHNISRLLDTKEDTLNNLITEHTIDINNTEKTYFGFHLQDTKTDKHQERKLTQLADDINKHKQLKQTINALQYVADSHKNLFF